MYIILNSYVGAGDPRDEVSNAAKSYLYGLVHKFHANESPSSEDKGQLLLPDFLEMSKLVIEKANMRIKTQQKVTIGSHVLPFTPGVYTEILNYLRMCLIYNSGVVPHLDMLRDPQTEAPKIFEYISQFVVHHNENSNPFSQLKDISQSQNTASKEVLKKLIHLNEIFLSATQGTPQAQCLLQLLAQPFVLLHTPVRGLQLAFGTELVMMTINSATFFINMRLQGPQLLPYSFAHYRGERRQWFPFKCTLLI